METEFVSVLRVAVDPDTDERGNVLAYALCRLSRMVALTMNAN